MKQPSLAEIDATLAWLEHVAQGAPLPPVEVARRGAGWIHLRLMPLIGASAVCALFLRSARSLPDAAPGLAAVCALESSEDALQPFFLHLEQMDPRAATQTSAALFATFFALLRSLLGERLTEQILDIQARQQKGKVASIEEDHE